MEEELRRVLPAVEAIAATVARPISVDTVKVEVARRALAAGAVILNDITGLSANPAMIRLAADTGAGVVVMHMAGTPQTMQLAPSYRDVVVEVYDWLARRVEALESEGIPRDRIAIDPGLGFGKTFEHNILLLRHTARFAELGCAVLVGTSRKGFLGKITGRAVDQRRRPPPSRRWRAPLPAPTSCASTTSPRWPTRSRCGRPFTAGRALLETFPNEHAS